MVKVTPFAALRPVPELAEKIASHPYDVLSSDEAREIIADNQYSFLRVVKPEATLDPSINPYDEAVYLRGKENLDTFINNGWLKQDIQPYFYAYRQIMGEHEQIGLVASASTIDYEEDRIKKHELTREAKEIDRRKHIETLNAQAGPVFLTYKATAEIDSLMSAATSEVPESDFRDELGIRHTFWVIKDKSIETQLVAQFKNLSVLYIADGHHRSACAAKIMMARRAELGDKFTGEEPFTGFLSVIFPHNQMYIMPYNRVIKKSPFASRAELVSAIEKNFVSEDVSDGTSTGTHDIRMYANSKWIRLTPKEGTYDSTDPVASLDCDILQKNLLAPSFKIENPRKSKNIDFVGGIRGIGELEKLVDTGKAAVAFSFFNVTIEQLMSIADAGKIMPPKSTWFEPKLKSGLAIQML